jgi:CII-binding regulator of phage lambda lysogenization HflD
LGGQRWRLLFQRKRLIETSQNLSRELHVV